MQSAEIEFTEDEAGNIVIVLEDFQPEIRDGIRAMLLDLIRKALVDFGATAQGVVASTGRGIEIPADPTTPGRN